MTLDGIWLLWTALIFLALGWTSMFHPEVVWRWNRAFGNPLKLTEKVYEEDLQFGRRAGGVLFAIGASILIGGAIARFFA